MLFSSRYWLVVFVVLVTFVILSRSFATEEPKSCDEGKSDQRYQPNVPHVVLNDTFLSRYDEVVVIGDVHGCLDELKLLLENANIDGPTVLKILAGDLVRKGPKSQQVVEFVRRTPHFLSVRGNNDENAMAMKRKPIRKLQTADKFVKNMSQADWEFLEQLPYSISIPNLNMIVVHAGLLPNVPVEETEPFTIMHVRNLLEDDACIGGFQPKTNLEDEGRAWGSVWAGPQHVVFGHDRKRLLQLHEKATGVDTACVYGKELSGLFVMGLRTGTIVQQPCPTNYKKKLEKEDDD